jgi:hypothetical protein
VFADPYVRGLATALSILGPLILLWAAHYYEYDVRKKRLPRFVTYTVGTSILLAGQAGFDLLSGYRDSALQHLAVVLCGGGLIFILHFRHFRVSLEEKVAPAAAPVLVPVEGAMARPGVSMEDVVTLLKPLVEAVEEMRGVIMVGEADEQESPP